MAVWRVDCETAGTGTATITSANTIPRGAYIEATDFEVTGELPDPDACDGWELLVTTDNAQGPIAGIYWPSSMGPSGMQFQEPNKMLDSTRTAVETPLRVRVSCDTSYGTNHEQPLPAFQATLTFQWTESPTEPTVTFR